jgi:hypothetical protein
MPKTLAEVICEATNDIYDYLVETNDPSSLSSPYQVSDLDPFKEKLKELLVQSIQENDDPSKDETIQIVDIPTLIDQIAGSRGAKQYFPIITNPLYYKIGFYLGQIKRRREKLRQSTTTTDSLWTDTDNLKLVKELIFFQISLYTLVKQSRQLIQEGLVLSLPEDDTNTTFFETGLEVDNPILQRHCEFQEEKTAGETQDSVLIDYAKRENLIPNDLPDTTVQSFIYSILSSKLDTTYQLNWQALQFEEALQNQQAQYLKLQENYDDLQRQFDEQKQLHQTVVTQMHNKLYQTERAYQAAVEAGQLGDLTVENTKTENEGLRGKIAQLTPKTKQQQANITALETELLQITEQLELLQQELEKKESVIRVLRRQNKDLSQQIDGQLESSEQFHTPSYQPETSAEHGALIDSQRSLQPDEPELWDTENLMINRQRARSASFTFGQSATPEHATLTEPANSLSLAEEIPELRIQLDEPAKPLQCNAQTQTERDAQTHTKTSISPPVSETPSPRLHAQDSSTQMVPPKSDIIQICTAVEVQRNGHRKVTSTNLTNLRNVPRKLLEQTTYFDITLTPPYHHINFQYYVKPCGDYRSGDFTVKKLCATGLLGVMKMIAERYRKVDIDNFIQPINPSSFWSPQDTRQLMLIWTAATAAGLQVYRKHQKIDMNFLQRHFVQQTTIDDITNIVNQQWSDKLTPKQQKDILDQLALITQQIPDTLRTGGTRSCFSTHPTASTSLISVTS